MIASARIIVYDGQCPLCNRWLSFLPPRDPEARISFCPMQTVTGATLMRLHGLDPVDPDSFLYLEFGRAWTGSDGIIRVLMALGGIWRACGLLRFIPRRLRDPGYRVIARNRYRWWGRTESCMIPSEELRRRFLDWPQR